MSVSVLGRLLLALGIVWLGLACSPAAAPPPAPAAAGAVAAATAPPAPTVVKVAIPARSLPFLPIQVAKERGFDLVNGIDLQMQMLGGTTSIQAMLAGEVEFAASAGATLNAALGGAPVVVLMIGIDKSTYLVYARPEVRAVGDLKGKVLAVDTVGGSQYTEVTFGLRQAGLDPSEVTIVSMPAPSRVAALESGSADAAVLVPPQDIQAEKLSGGHRRLLSLGDYVVGINGGLGTSTALLQSKPALVDATVRTVLMGLEYLKANREGSLPAIASFLDVDAETAAMIYDRYAGAFGDGQSTPATRAEIVQHALEALKGAEPTAPDSAFHLAPVQRAAASLQASGWRPN